MYFCALISVYNYSHLQQKCIICMSIFCPSRLPHDLGDQYGAHLKYATQLRVYSLCAKEGGSYNCIRQV